MFAVLFASFPEAIHDRWYLLVIYFQLVLGTQYLFNFFSFDEDATWCKLLGVPDLSMSWSTDGKKMFYLVPNAAVLVLATTQHHIFAMQLKVADTRAVVQTWSSTLASIIFDRKKGVRLLFYSIHAAVFIWLACDALGQTQSYTSLGNIHTHHTTH